MIKNIRPNLELDSMVFSRHPVYYERSANRHSNVRWCLVLTKKSSRAQQITQSKRYHQSKSGKRPITAIENVWTWYRQKQTTLRSHKHKWYFRVPCNIHRETEGTDNFIIIKNTDLKVHGSVQRKNFLIYI